MTASREELLDQFARLVARAVVDDLIAELEQELYGLHKQLPRPASEQTRRADDGHSNNRP